ncbi:MAG: hypothetical protein ABI251_06830 [Mycobacteriaceae bacterium]
MTPPTHPAMSYPTRSLRIRPASAILVAAPSTVVRDRQTINALRRPLRAVRRDLQFAQHAVARARIERDDAQHQYETAVKVPQDRDRWRR